MLVSSSHSSSFSLHFLPIMPSVLRSGMPPPVAWAFPPTSPSSPSSRSSSPAYSRATSCDGSQTIHHRRTVQRAKTASDVRTPPPPALHGFSDFFHARTGTAALLSVPVQQQHESDAECWERMLALQREYHCYKSARLEAAVEALERGYSIADVPMRELSRLLSNPLRIFCPW